MISRELGLVALQFTDEAHEVNFPSDASVELADNSDFGVQLFFDFANQRVLKAFSRLRLASWKLPLVWALLPLTALAAEVIARCILNDGCDDGYWHSAELAREVGFD